MLEPCVRHHLPRVTDFNRFWKEAGPFKYALTSREFPPILLEEEEWIFGSDIHLVLKELMQPDGKKIGFVHSPFNPKNKNILRPGDLSPWKINNFPEEWDRVESDLFVPRGHLTRLVMDEAERLANLAGPVDNQKDDNPKVGKQDVEKAYFDLLSERIESMGYHVLKPLGKSKFASIRRHLSEWEEDEKESG
jgi:hypothetical protein